MGFSQFFVRRPIFAAVLSAIIFIAGALSLRLLPISEYPEVVPPTVVVRATYPGANPQVIAETVASPLEQAINGVENMLYTSSQSTTDGLMTLTVTFGLGTDLDKAQVQVQNRVSQTLPKLPEVTQRLGVTTEKTAARSHAARAPDLARQPLRHALPRELRAAARARRARAHRRRRRRAGLRRRRLRDARVARPGKGLRAEPHGERRRARDPRAERAGRGRPARRAARAESGADFQVLIDTQGRLVNEEEFENIDGEGRRARPNHAPARRRARRARREHLCAALAARRSSPRPRSRSINGRAATRSTSRTRCARRWRAREGFPGGRRLRHRLRPDDVRAPVDRRRRAHAVRGARCSSCSW